MLLMVISLLPIILTKSLADNLALSGGSVSDSDLVAIIMSKVGP